MIPFGDATESYSLHGHHHWNEHVRDIGRCRFAKYKNETYVIMLRWSKTKPNYKCLLQTRSPYMNTRNNKK